MSKVIAFPRNKKLTARQKTGIAILAAIEGFEAAKAKIDDYFGVDGSLHDQLWFYITIGFSFIVAVVMVVMNIFNIGL